MPKKKRRERDEKPRRRYCFFCKNKIEHIDYKDVELLKRFLSDKGKIRARRTTGVCVQHQHRLSQEVKRARQMALLSFTGK